MEQFDKKSILTKKYFEDVIRTLVIISGIFFNSKLLVGGRNEVMMRRIYSYIGIICHIYEFDYHFGHIYDIVNDVIAMHYDIEVKGAMNGAKRNLIIKELADNWSDVLQVIFISTLDKNPTGDQFKAMEIDIQKVTTLIETLSGSKCKKPTNPLNVIPKNVTYNPYNITEDLNLSRGHILPNFTEVFARELIPQLVYTNHINTNPKDIVYDYALSMIQSYYENAGFVPMIIVDQITGQINQVVEMVQRVSYEPYSSLKDYLLSKIYK